MKMRVGRTVSARARGVAVQQGEGDGQLKLSRIRCDSKKIRKCIGGHGSGNESRAEATPRSEAMIEAETGRFVTLYEPKYGVIDLTADTSTVDNESLDWHEERKDERQSVFSNNYIVNNTVTCMRCMCIMHGTMCYECDWSGVD